MIYAEVEPIEIVVCGGAALIALKLVSRTTQDVDIVALAQKEGETVAFQRRRKLPKNLRQVISEVAVEMNMEPDWLNFAASPLLKFGLPPGIETRLKKKRYGECLTVHFVDR